MQLNQVLGARCSFFFTVINCGIGFRVTLNQNNTASKHMQFGDEKSTVYRLSLLL